MAEKKSSMSTDDIAELKAMLRAELLAEMKYDIKAEVKEATSAMDRPLKKVVAESTPDLDEMVTIQLFKDGKDYKDDCVVGVNGKQWQIKRGMPVTIPKYVALVIESGQRQDVYASTISEDAENRFTTAVNNGAI